MSTEMFNVYGFVNTGLNPSNSPSSISMLFANPSINNYIINFEPIYRLQPYVLDSIDVDKPFISLQGLDYIVLRNSSYEDIGYFVTDIQMINTNNARIYLVLDAVGTVGLGVNSNYKLLSGWATRRHYTTTEDTLFSNVLPEAFTPTKPSVMNYEEITFNNDRTNLVASTLNLSDNLGKLKLDNYLLESKTATIIKPIIVGGTSPTKITLPQNSETGGFPQTIQNLTLYDGEILGQETFNKLQAFDMMNVITASYQVPTELLSASSKEGARFTSISGTGKGYTSNLGYNFSSYIPRNKKVISTGSSYSLISVLSGESLSFDAWELYHGGQSSPRFNIMADITPSGKPYCRPEYYRGIKGTGLFAYFKTVAGTSWANVPIITNGENGWAYNSLLENQNSSAYKVHMGYLNNKFILDSQLHEINYEIERSDYNINRSSLVNQQEHLLNSIAQAKFNVQASEKLSFGEAGRLIGAGLTSGITGNTNLTFSKTPYEIGERQLSANKNLENLRSEQEHLGNLISAHKANKSHRMGKLDNELSNMKLNSQYALDNLMINRQKELAAFTRNVTLSPPTYSFANDSNLQNFLGNGFILIRENLSDEDVKRFDDYLSLFGYSVNEPLQASFFKTRRYFNYVCASNVSVSATNGKLPQYVLETLTSQLAVGVRVWHTIPNELTYEQRVQNPSI